MIQLKTILTRTININSIKPNPSQPRKAFEEKKIKELANSIEQNGLINPIVVYEVEVGEKYEIESGERRWRAYQHLYKKTKDNKWVAIPAIIKKKEGEEKDRKIQSNVNSIVENIQREDLTPIEKAEAIMDLKKKTRWSYRQIGKKIGIGEGTIRNIISLYKKLEPEQREKVVKEKMGRRKIQEMIKKKKSSRDDIGKKESPRKEGKGVEKEKKEMAELYLENKDYGKFSAYVAGLVNDYIDDPETREEVVGEIVEKTKV